MQIHSFHKHLLSTYFVPNLLLSAGDKMIHNMWSPLCNSIRMQSEPYGVSRDRRLCLGSVFPNHRDSFRILMFGPMALNFCNSCSVVYFIWDLPIHLLFFQPGDLCSQVHNCILWLLYWEGNTGLVVGVGRTWIDSHFTPTIFKLVPLTDLRYFKILVYYFLRQTF